MVRLLLKAVVDLIIDCGEAVIKGCCWPDHRLW